MAVVPSDIAQPFIRRESIVGPVTSARHRRNAMIYGAMCILGLMPTLLGMSPSMQATGLGLWIPGGGFLAVGGWAAEGLDLDQFNRDIPHGSEVHG